MFVFLLSVLLLKETITVTKVVSVLLCVVGVIVLSIGDISSSKTSNPLLGNILTVFSAIFAAFYMVLYARLYTAKQSFVSVLIWLSCIGTNCLFIFWPILVVLNYYGFESITIPNESVLMLMLLGILGSFLFNLLLNYGIITVSPLAMRLVTLLSIPASFIISVVYYKQDKQFQQYCGAAMILLGFALFSVIRYREEQQKVQFDSKDKCNYHVVQEQLSPTARNSSLRSKPTIGVEIT